MKKVALARSRKPIPKRSAKMEAKYSGPDGRRALVARLLERYPTCQFKRPVITSVMVTINTRSPEGAIEQAHKQIQAQYDELDRNGWPKCKAPSQDIHEILSRARGGSILDESNCIALCRPHHTWATDHPKEAEAMGLSKRRWPRVADNVAGK